MERHALDAEMTGWFGVKRSTTDAAGKPLKFTQGIIPFMRENNPSNILNYVSQTGADYEGMTWLQAGKKWLNYYFSVLFTYLEGEAMCWCGNKALNGIQELAETFGDINLKAGDKSYGLKVVEWITPHGTVYFKTHPLFSRDTTMANMMVLGHPKNAKFCPKVKGSVSRRTTFQTDMQLPGQDGKLDGFITEGGWKWYFPNQWMILNGVGEANTV